MRLQQGAWAGLVLGVWGGLAAFFALLAMQFNPSVSVSDGEAGCGTGLLGFFFFGPVIALVLLAIGGGMGCLFGLLVGGLYDSAERAKVSRSPRMIVSPHCSNCGRYATIPERNISALCPGCGEPLPRVPSKPAVTEL
jgi:hypothetical protein